MVSKGYKLKRVQCVKEHNNANVLFVGKQINCSKIFYLTPNGATFQHCNNFVDLLVTTWCHNQNTYCVFHRTPIANIICTVWGTTSRSIFCINLPGALLNMNRFATRECRIVDVVMYFPCNQRLEGLSLCTSLGSQRQSID